ncbi:MAG: hypothetical protein QOH96_4188 [Blastocatellia bacterium]|jgi:hypothetical protein|nr:hypothetical protein [Blastocatellia bacterium]
MYHMMLNTLLANYFSFPCVSSRIDPQLSSVSALPTPPDESAERRFWRNSQRVPFHELALLHSLSRLFRVLCQRFSSWGSRRNQSVLRPNLSKPFARLELVFSVLGHSGVMKRTVVWLTNEQVKVLTALSKKSLAPVSALVRRAVKEFLQDRRKSPAREGMRKPH